MSYLGFVLTKAILHFTILHNGRSSQEEIEI